MPKYGKKAQEKVEKTMHEFKRGELKSSSGDKVTNRKQAIAIGLSEAREAGGKVPGKAAKRSAKKTGRPAKKRASATKKTARKTRTSRKSPRKSTRS
jgi:hypothetical protein